MNTNVKVTRFITVTGMLAAIAVVLYTYAEFPLLPAYPFLQYDFSDVVAIIGGIFVAPACGITIQLLKNLIHFFIKGSAGGLGELANLLTGLLFITPVIFLFKKSRILAFIAGAACFIGGAILLNYYIFLPLYGMEEVRTQVVWEGITPFNVIKAAISSVSAILLWKLLSPLKKKIAFN